MLVKTEGKLWLDTPAVQVAVTEFHGKHIGFGDFRVVVNDEAVLFTRIDGTAEGESLRQRHGFTARPYRADGPPLALARLTARLLERGHELVQEEDGAHQS